MKYEMPVLTEQQKAELIDYLSCGMDYSYQDHKRLTKLIDQIALAALTAEPEDGLFILGVELSLVKGRETISQATPMPSGEFHHSCFKMYTAPPVPVLNPIDLTSCRNLWYDHDDLSAEVKCIPVKDIKKAIRAAGYEVKE